MGLTPVDTGYTYAGYIVAGAVLNYLRPVLISVVIGSLIWKVYHSLLAGSLKPLIVYFITMFLVVSFFIARTSPPAPVSVGEQGGRKVVMSSTDVARSIIGNLNTQTSLGLVWIGRFLDSLTITTARLIESGGAVRVEDRVVGGVPFFYARAYQEVMANRIQDPEVRAEFIDFIATSYTNALQRWNDAGRPRLPVGKTILYPGDIIAQYGTPEDQNKWNALQDKIYADFSGRSSFHSRLIPNFIQKHFIIQTIKNEFADRDTITAISNKMLENSTYYMAGKGTSGIDLIGLIGGAFERTITTFVSHLCSIFAYFLTGLILPMLPTIQGMINFLVLVAFPFVFLFSLFPNNFQILSKYFLTMVWAKSLTIAWAILNCFQNLGWVFASSQGQNVLSWTLQGLPIFGTLAGIFVLPVLFFKIIAEGVAYAEEILTGKVVEKGEKVVGKIGQKGAEALQ